MQRNAHGVAAYESSQSRRMLDRGILTTLLATLLTVAMLSCLCFPTQAWAYFSKEAVGVYLGASSVSLVQGQSTTVSVSVDMWSEQQLPGCGMSECPQACSSLVNPDTGELGGCLNSEGWCTCAGTTYQTYYTQLSVTSSNPSVARATVSGSSLTIQAYSVGTTTITVRSSLSKHQDGSASMTVTVSAASSSDSSSSTSSSSGSSSSSSSDSSSSSSSSSGSSSSSSASSGSTSSGSSGVSVSAVGTSATAAAAASVAESGSEETEVVEIETEDGVKIIVVEATDAETAAEYLKEIAGTEGTVTFWSGGTLDSPLISWTFYGQDLSEDEDFDIDPTVTVNNTGTGDVATLLSGVDDVIVMDFAYSGDLPATAEVYVRTSGTFADGELLDLYYYDEENQKFLLEQEDIEISDGYAVFQMDHCSVWALSQTDLTSLEMPEDQSSSEDEVDATQVKVVADDGGPYLVAGIIIAVVILVCGVVFVVLRRRRVTAEDAAQKAAAEALFGADADRTDDADKLNAAGLNEPADSADLADLAGEAGKTDKADKAGEADKADSLDVTEEAKPADTSDPSDPLVSPEEN